MWRVVLVELHVDATGPLDNGVAPDRAAKRRNQYIAARCTDRA